MQIAILKERVGVTGPYGDFFVDPNTSRFFDDEDRTLLEQRDEHYAEQEIPF